MRVCLLQLFLFLLSQEKNTVDIDTKEVVAQIDEYLAEHPEHLHLIDKDQVVQDYKAYLNRPRYIHNQPLRDKEQTFFEAMSEIDSLSTPDENKKFYDMIQRVCK